MKLKNIRNFILVLTWSMLFGLAGYRLGEKQALSFSQDRPISVASFKQQLINQEAGNSKADFAQFWEVWSALENKYYDSSKIDPQKMVYGAISGMVSSLEDPWTVFLPPKENQRAKEDLNGQFEGVGIQLGYKNETLAVIAPLKGTPAEQKGVKAGDLILRIKDEAKDIDVSTADISIYQAVEYIRGPKGSEVELTMSHDDGREPFVVKIDRGTIAVASVELSFGRVEDGRWQSEEATVGDKPTKMVAWFKVNRFGDNTLTEWVDAVAKIDARWQEKSISGVVLDLRNNPGGYLSGAVSLGSEFFAKGVIVKQENADGTVENYSVNRKGLLLDIPVVVVVNKGSASASEILAGVLQKRGRAIIVGEKTFGKGTIQEAMEMEYNSGLHVTTAKWLLPDDTWLKNNEGLDPDIVVENPQDDDTLDLQLVKAAEELLK